MSFGDDSQRVEEAVCKAKSVAALAAMSADTERTVCPACRHETLVTRTKKGDYCFYCRKEYHMTRCTGCQCFVAEVKADEYGLCPKCCGRETVVVP